MDFDGNDRKDSPDWGKSLEDGEPQRHDTGDREVHEPVVGDPRQPVVSESADSPLGLAPKLAGIILLVNSVFIAIEAFVLPGEAGSSSQSIGGIVGTIIISGMLLSGNPKGLVWARIVVILGGVVFTIKPVMEGDLFSAGFQLVFSASLILLLFGSPGKKRIVLSLVFAGLCFLLETLGIVMEITGENYIGAAILESTSDLTDLPGNTLQGHACGYTLAFPPDGQWRAMSQQQIQRDNPDADAWVMNPVRDLHVMIIVEAADFDVDTLVDIIIENASQGLEKFDVQSRSNVQTTSGLTGRVVEASGSVDGMAIGYKYGLFTNNGRAYQIVCFTGQENYPQFEATFANIISSFVPAPDVLPRQDLPIQDAGTDVVASQPSPI
jgi:hypothetical protein